MFGRLRRRGRSGADEAPTSPDGHLPAWTQEAHLLGLRDAHLAGFYRTDGGELYAGVPVSREDLVLDVGCGDGGALAFCAGMGADVVAVDHDPATIATARDLVSSRGAGRKTFVVGSAEDLPLSDGRATRVLCMEVLEHVGDPHKVLRELHRVGSPGALYLLTVPDPRGEELLKVLGPADYFAPPNHIRIIEREQFADWVRQAGLEVLEQDYYGFYRLLWLGLCWSRNIADDGPADPTLVQWTRTWQALLDSPQGADVQRLLDRFMAKSQVIVARKPR